MNLKTILSPEIYIPLNNFYPSRFPLSNQLYPDRLDKSKTIEIITLHGYNVDEFINKLNNLDENNELYSYINNRNTTAYDKSPLSDFVIFAFGSIISLTIIYYFKFIK